MKSIKNALAYSQILFLLLIPIWMELTRHLNPLVVIVAWFCFSSLFIFFFCFIKKEKIIMSKRLMHTIMTLYSIGLLILLFFRPKHQNYGSLNFIPFETIQLYLSGRVDFLIAFYNLGANVGLFIPFGLYYRYVKNKPSILQLLIITACTISLIEVSQFLTKRGSLDIDDLILNVVGACLGYTLYPLFINVLIIKQLQSSST